MIGRILLVTEVVVGLSVLSVIVRSSTWFGQGPSTVGVGGALFLVVLAAPSFALPVLTRRWRWVCLAECALALAAWVLLGVAGDVSCVDCGLAVVIPFAMVVPQVLVALGAMLFARYRS